MCSQTKLSGIKHNFKSRNEAAATTNNTVTQRRRRQMYYHRKITNAISIQFICLPLVCSTHGLHTGTSWHVHASSIRNLIILYKMYATTRTGTHFAANRMAKINGNLSRMVYSNAHQRSRFCYARECGDFECRGIAFKCQTSARVY